jgi:ceramide glucosyltransferase
MMIAAILLVFWIAVSSLMISGTIASVVQLRRRSSRPSSTPPADGLPHLPPPVTILKPLCGLDDGLEDNLRSFFRLDYERFEIIFSVAEVADPARAVVQRLIAEHPEVDAKLITGAQKAGPNPKIDNLLRGYACAKHDLLWISDSSIRVEPDALARAAAAMEDDVGLATAVVAGVSPASLGARLEASFLNGRHVRAMSLAGRAGGSAAVGKSMLFRRSHCERFGGLRAVVDFLAEDHLLGETMRKLGLRVVLLADPIAQHLGRVGLAEFWRRHVRWGRIRKSRAPLSFALEGAGGAAGAGLCGAYALAELFGVAPLLFLAGHFLLWASCDLHLMRRLQAQRVRWWAPLVWGLREMLALPLWVHILCGRSVTWRGHRLRVLAGGVIEPGRGEEPEQDERELGEVEREERSPARMTVAC